MSKVFLRFLHNFLLSEKYFNDWNKILLDKDEKDKMDSFAIISRDDLTRRKVADEMKIAADKQAKYESQLKKIGVPVIVGLVSLRVGN
jgi:hexosaminidase